MTASPAQIVPLYATPLVECQHPDPAALNAELKALFLARAAEGDRYRNRLMTAGKNGLFESEFDLFKWPEACVQRLRPTAHQAIAHAVRDAVDLSMRAARRLLRDETVIARSARLMNVEKRDDVALLEWIALDVRDRTAKLLDHTDRHVAGNQRIGDARQLAMVQVNVCPANLGEQHVKQ